MLPLSPQDSGALPGPEPRGQNQHESSAARFSHASAARMDQEKFSRFFALEDLEQ